MQHATFKGSYTFTLTFLILAFFFFKGTFKWKMLQEKKLKKKKDD